jgi:hypothetical protein
MKYKRNTFKVKSEKDFSRYPLMEKELDKWIREKRSKGCCISGLAIRQQAAVIYQQDCGDSFSNFQASNGWLSNFLKQKKRLKTNNNKREGFTSKC